MTGTRTTTYTVADVRKVVENFAADYSMMAQATGLETRETVAKVASDLRVFAENDYLIAVRLFLLDNNGNKLRVASYQVSASAVGWRSDDPGGDLWPKTPGGSLRVLTTFTDEWWGKSDAEKVAFAKKEGLHYPWSAASWDTSLDGLQSSAGQKYASNGYGWERTNYSN